MNDNVLPPPDDDEARMARETALLDQIAGELAKLPVLDDRPIEEIVEEINDIFDPSDEKFALTDVLGVTP